MRAVVVREACEIEDLEISEVPDPDAGPMELLVRVFATTVAAMDVRRRKGESALASGILGHEWAGEVAAVGEGVAGFERGQRVFGISDGGACADFLAIDHRLAMPLPDTMSFESAAAIPESFFAAEEALFLEQPVDPPSHLLVHADSFGLAAAVTQVARFRGAKVALTTLRAGELDFYRGKGADLAFRHRNDDFQRILAREWGLQSIDLVLDLIGDSCSLHGGSLLQEGCRVLVADSLFRGRSLDEISAISARFRREILPELASGRFQPLVDSVELFEDVRDAHAQVERGAHFGKVVLRL